MSEATGGSGGGVNPYMVAARGTQGFLESLLNSRNRGLKGDLLEEELNRFRTANVRGGGLFNRGLKMFGKDIYDPRESIFRFQQATAGIRGRNAQAIDKRLDLDSGTAQGELARINNPMLMQFLLQGDKQNAFAMSNRNMGLLEMLSSVYGR